MMPHYKDTFAKGTWVSYRPEIKLHDCTIRDGGLINDHMFEDGFVQAVYRALAEAGIDYMELGYKGDKKIFSRSESGAWKFCDEDDMRRVVGDEPRQIKLSVMADAERTDYHHDILPKDQSVIDCIRVATYIHQVPTAIDMLKDAHDKGYETTVNLMAVSTVQERELQEALEAFAKTPADVVYLVDSFGSFYSEQIRDLVATVFHEFVSESIQHLVHEMGVRILDRFPQISEISFAAQNRTRDPFAESEDDPKVKVYSDPFNAYGEITLTMAREGGEAPA